MILWIEENESNAHNISFLPKLFEFGVFLSNQNSLYLNESNFRWNIFKNFHVHCNVRQVQWFSVRKTRTLLLSIWYLHKFSSVCVQTSYFNGVSAEKPSCKSFGVGLTNLQKTKTSTQNIIRWKWVEKKCNCTIFSTLTWKMHHNAHYTHTHTPYSIDEYLKKNLYRKLFVTSLERFTLLNFDSDEQQYVQLHICLKTTHNWFSCKNNWWYINTKKKSNERKNE